MLKPRMRLEDESLEALSPAFKIARPAQWRAGVVFASPHSGNIYPKSFVDRSHLTLAQLRKNEDIFIDKLFGPCIATGAPMLKARFPRCYVDVNRAEDELSPEWLDTPVKPSIRAQAGLGVVPTHISESTQIYKRGLNIDIARLRLSRLYRPYHNALGDLLAECVERFGQALLVDCHSMPGFSPMGARRPDIILGDRFGKSCHPDTVSRIQRIFRSAGYTVSTNYPYAGGFVTTHYGRPEAGIEAIQIEINRDLYLNPVTLTPKRGYDRLAGDLVNIIREIIQQSRAESQAAQ